MSSIAVYLPVSVECCLVLLSQVGVDARIIDVIPEFVDESPGADEVLVEYMHDGRTLEWPFSKSPSASCGKIYHMIM